MSLRAVPVDPPTAKAFCRMWHRTHKTPPPSHKFSVGVADEQDVLRGIAIVGWPVAIGNMDGMTLEVNRTATDGTRNANSLLYGAAARAAKALGFRRIITYNQEGESGASLHAANYVPVAELGPRSGGDTPSRRREAHGLDDISRIRWERILSPGARLHASVARRDDPERCAEMPMTLWEAL